MTMEKQVQPVTPRYFSKAEEHVIKTVIIPNLGNVPNKALRKAIRKWKKGRVLDSTELVAIRDEVSFYFSAYPEVFAGK